MYQILGFGSPNIDLMANVPDSFLQEIGALKGSMELLDEKAFQKILQKVHEVKALPGGSTTNVIRGLAHLGNKCAIFGCIGKDAYANVYIDMCERLSIVPLLKRGTLPTARILCLVTPDTERTFLVYPGASKEITDSDLSEDVFTGVKMIHLEGYLVLYPEYLQAIIEKAGKAGVLISFDLGNFKVVEENVGFIKTILRNVDLLFGNSVEAEIVTGMKPEEACINISRMYGCTAVVSMGKEGVWSSDGGVHVYCPANKVRAIDSTGAGDLFAAGYIDFYLEGKGLFECCSWGAKVAGKVVQVLGPDLPWQTWEALRVEKHDSSVHLKP